MAEVSDEIESTGAKIKRKRRERNERAVSGEQESVWDFWDRFPKLRPRGRIRARGARMLTFDEWHVLDKKREQYRRKRDWKRADAIRDRLSHHGIDCHDF